MNEEPNKDTLPQWLCMRFGGIAWNYLEWNSLDQNDRNYWEHEAAAVRRAVARNGFKVAPE